MPSGLLLTMMLFFPADEPTWLTGARFRDALKEPLTANWRNVPLKGVLERISLERRVAIVLDRRIDPTQTWPMEFINEPLADGLANMAHRFAGELSLPGNAAYLGPAGAASKLRTLIALRTAELAAAELSIPKNRQRELLRLQPVTWDELDSPREILERVLRSLELECRNLSLVEHDLWGSGEWPPMTGIEALSLILVQFDLTFAWQDEGRAITLSPIPELVRLEKTYRPRKQTVSTSVADWSLKWSAARFEEQGAEVRVWATVEVHEEIAAENSGRTPPVRRRTPDPLKKQTFSLRIKETPVRDLMTELEKSGVRFEFDAEELRQAGIDLHQLIELDVRLLPAAEFFEAVFGPLGLESTIDGETVKLRVK